MIKPIPLQTLAILLIGWANAEEEIVDIAIPEIVDIAIIPEILAPDISADPPQFSLPCDEIASICFNPDSRICDLKCKNHEPKEDCRARRGCDNLPTMKEIKKCRQDCKLSSPKTCRDDCMSQQLSECNQSECEDIVSERNRISPGGETCEETFRLCLETYRQFCTKQCTDEAFPSPDEWVPCEEVCEANADDICRPKMEECQINRVNDPAEVEAVSPCEERSPPAPDNCFCDYEFSRIGYSTATRLTFEAWCVAGTGADERCGLYKCPECAPFDRSSCFSVGSSGGYAGLYEQACPPSTCDSGLDQPMEGALWCQNGPDSTPCGPYFGIDCIPRHVYHPAQCEYEDGTSALQDYSCPAPRQGCDECDHPDHAECYVGSKKCSYCSLDCVPTGDFPVNGFGDFIQGRCDELIPVP